MQEKQKCDELQAGVIYAEAVWGELQPTLVPHKLCMYLLENSCRGCSDFFG